MDFKLSSTDVSKQCDNNREETVKEGLQMVSLFKIESTKVDSGV